VDRLVQLLVNPVSASRNADCDDADRSRRRQIQAIRVRAQAQGDLAAHKPLSGRIEVRS